MSSASTKSYSGPPGPQGPFRYSRAFAKSAHSLRQVDSSAAVNQPTIDSSSPTSSRTDSPSTDSPTLNLPIVRSSTIGTTHERTTKTQWHTCKGGCDGFHCKFKLNEKLPFDQFTLLGHGTYGAVQKARSTTIGTFFAIKEITSSPYLKKGSQGEILQEITTHRRLKHKHISKTAGSYQRLADRGARVSGIIMQPVADCDLRAFLGEVQWKRDLGRDCADNLALLMDAPGCLASGLGYLHKEKVRHKDIKPANILVYNGTFLLTDFGLSRDFSGGGHSTSTGQTSCTKKVSKPPAPVIRS